MDHSKMDHAAMGHGQPVAEAEDQPAPEMDHAAMGHNMPASPTANGPLPPRALEGARHAADAIWGAAAMQPSRDELVEVHGSMKVGKVMIERLEARVGQGDAGYLWDAEVWYGGDLDKFWLKSEGEGAFDDDVEDAEVQVLYSRAITPFWDVQAGARLDVEPDLRSHLVLGMQGLAPYMWHVDAAAFLSDRGDLTARIEAEYDQKITQKLILQPRMEVELSAQDISERDVGAGLTKIEPGLRLRYEITREFAPYVGVEYEAKLGRTADIARAQGEDPDAIKFLIGIRAWF
jgi:copper resistance protein B